MSESYEIYEFGGFRLDPARRSLIGQDGPVALSSRAFDILVLLVEQRDRVVSKDEIMSRVWRGTIVEENNLAVQISALRRALNGKSGGMPLIATVAGQGYRFVGQMQTAMDAPPPEKTPPFQPAVTPLPPPPGKPVPLAARRFGWIIPAIVAALAASVYTAYLARHRALPPPISTPGAVGGPPRLSLAVLPFRNLSADRGDDYLADAIGDDLTTDLSHIPGSTVIARESSDIYRGQNVLTPDIGRALNVRYLLEGSLRRTEGKFSINAQLIEAATQSHVWAERFSVPREHIAEAQETIVRHLASALGVTLVESESARSLREHAGNPDAVDLFLRARSVLDRSDTLESLTRAQGLLEQARVIQPDNADVASALGWLLLRKVHSFGYVEEAEDLAEARQIVAKALQLAPDSTAALADQGLLFHTDHDDAAALVSFDAALALDRNNVLAQNGRIRCLETLGRYEEAIDNLNALLRIDPEGPQIKLTYFNLGQAYIMLGKFSEAATWLRRAENGDPPPAPGANEFGRVEWGKLLEIVIAQVSGDTSGAHALYVAYDRIWPHRTAWLLANQFSRAQSTLPAFQRVIDALKAAGMPGYALETEDSGISPEDQPAVHGGFGATPTSLPGVPTIATTSLSQLMQADHPIIIDTGLGVAVPDGGHIQRQDWTIAEAQALIESARRAPGAASRPVVIMGTSVFMWSSYELALQLHLGGVTGLAWYRGGEEAWAHANMPANDLRTQ